MHIADLNFLHTLEELKRCATVDIPDYVKNLVGNDDSHAVDPLISYLELSTSIHTLIHKLVAVKTNIDQKSGYPDAKLELLSLEGGDDFLGDPVGRRVGDPKSGPLSGGMSGAMDGAIVVSFCSTEPSDSTVNTNSPRAPSKLP